MLECWVCPRMSNNAKVHTILRIYMIRWTFSLRTWNYFNHDGLLTNNHVEGWHNCLKKMVWKAHPNLTGTSQSLRVHWSDPEVTIEQLSGARRVRAKKMKVVRHEETFQKLTEEFTGGVRTLESFLSSLIKPLCSFFWLLTYTELFIYRHTYFIRIRQAVRNNKFTP